MSRLPGERSCQGMSISFQVSLTWEAQEWEFNFVLTFYLLPSFSASNSVWESEGEQGLHSNQCWDWFIIAVVRADEKSPDKAINSKSPTWRFATANFKYSWTARYTTRLDHAMLFHWQTSYFEFQVCRWAAPPQAGLSGLLGPPVPQSAWDTGGGPV